MRLAVIKITRQHVSSVRRFSYKEFSLAIELHLDLRSILSVFTAPTSILTNGCDYK